MFLRGNDFSARDELIGKLRRQVRRNQEMNNGPVLAAGMSEYMPEKDNLVSEIFDRADRKMYEDKLDLKNITD